MKKTIKLIWCALLATTSAKAQYTMNTNTTINQMPSFYRTESIADPFSEAIIFPPSSLYSTSNYPYAAIPWSHLTMDAGGSIYFINSVGIVYTYTWDTNLGWQLVPLCSNQYVNMAPYAGLLLNSYKLFSIGTDGKAYNFYQSAGSWLVNALDPTQSVTLGFKAGLVADAAGVIYGIGTDGMAYSFTYTGGATPYTCTQLCSQFIGLRSDVKLTYEAATGKLYGIGTDGKAYNFYKSGGVWQFNCLNPSQSVGFDPKCPLVLDAAGIVYGIGTNGNVYSLTYTGGSPPFAFTQLCTQSVTVDAAGQLTYETSTGKFYVVGTDGKVYNFYKPSGSWSFAPLNSSQSTLTNANGGLTLSNGNIYCIGADGKIDYFYYQSGWQFSPLTSSQQLVADPAVGVLINNRVVYCAGTKTGSFNSNHLGVLYYKAQTLTSADWTSWGTPVLNEEFKTYTGYTDANFISNWTGCLPWGHNTTPAYEYEYLSPSAHSFITDPSDATDKCLRITSTNVPLWGKCDDNLPNNAIMNDGNQNYRQFNYTGGAIFGNTSYQYGLFTARIKWPSGTGFWPAFWTFGSNSWPPEMDIMECHGSLPYEITNNVFWRDPNGNVDHSYMEYKSATNFTAAYHTYTMIWTPDFMTFYIDDQELRTVDHHVPRVPMNIIANLSVGLQDPSSSPFPSYMDIDYIRVYQKASYPSPKSMEIVQADEAGEKTDNLVIYPNPGTGIFNISMNSSDASVVEVYDLQGNLVTKTQMFNTYQLDLTGKEKGTYVVRITTDGKQMNKKIILE